jgi:sugar phosphate isomerase/epimerase
MVGFDGWLSIEHEDVILGREVGVQKSVDLLRGVVPMALSDYKP